MMADENLTRPVTLIPAAQKALANLVTLLGASSTDCINRAIVLAEYLEVEVATGKTVKLVDADGQTSYTVQWETTPLPFKDGDDR